MDETTKALMGKGVAFIRRGGAGKSTQVVLVARELRRRGASVCILDADSTNSGLHRALEIEEAPEAMVRYFGGMVFPGGAVACPVDRPDRIENRSLFRQNRLKGLRVVINRELANARG